MLKDLRHGARTLLRDKGWTAVVVLSLALGIGANTALFSAVNGLFLKKLPVRDPDTLVRLKWAGKNDMVTDSSDYGFSAKDTAGQTVRAHVLLSRCSSSSSPTTARWTISSRARRTAASTSSSTVRPTSPAPSSRPGNYYRMLGLHREPRTHDRAGATIGRRAAGRGDQRALLALALRRRSAARSARSCRSTTCR